MIIFFFLILDSQLFSDKVTLFGNSYSSIGENRTTNFVSFHSKIIDVLINQSSSLLFARLNNQFVNIQTIYDEINLETDLFIIHVCPQSTNEEQEKRRRKEYI